MADELRLQTLHFGIDIYRGFASSVGVDDAPIDEDAERQLRNVADIK